MFLARNQQQQHKKKKSLIHTYKKNKKNMLNFIFYVFYMKKGTDKQDLFSVSVSVRMWRISNMQYGGVTIRKAKGPEERTDGSGGAGEVCVSPPFSLFSTTTTSPGGGTVASKVSLRCRILRSFFSIRGPWLVFTPSQTRWRLFLATGHATDFLLL